MHAKANATRCQPSTTATLTTMTITTTTSTTTTTAAAAAASTTFNTTTPMATQQSRARQSPGVNQAQWLCFNPHCPSRSSGFQTEHDLKAHFAHYLYCADITASTWRTARQAMAQSSQTTTRNTAHHHSTYTICVAGLFPDGVVPAALQNLGTTNQLQHGLANVRNGLCTKQPALRTTQDSITGLALFGYVDKASQYTPPIPTVIVPQATAQVIRNAALPAGTAAANVTEQQQQQPITQGQVPVATHTTT